MTRAPHLLSRRDARRVAVRAQLLDQPRPTDAMAVVRHLWSLQADQTVVVAPSAELVLWSRLGSAYPLGGLERLAGDGTLIDVRGMWRPAEDVALLRAEMAAWPPVSASGWAEAYEGWVAANDDCRRDVLAALRADGPLTTRELPDTIAVPWRSSGWTHDRSVRKLVDILVLRGEVALAGREGRDPLWDLAERVYPDDPLPPLEEATRLRAARRLASLGIARVRSTEDPADSHDAVGEPAVVEGVRGSWRVDPAYLDGPFHGRAALLSPLDRLVFDRKRMSELFEFDFQLEMYKPAATRRWGYWAMPVLYGDRLVGKLDATADRDAGVLRVDAVHRDDEWSGAMAEAVERELRGLAHWLGLELDRPG